jgi:flagellar basal body rod protein FlgG
MIKGLYAAVSSMLVNSTRQQTLAHNIANMQTPGFKEVLSTVRDFIKTPVQYSPGNLLQDSSLTFIGNLGLGAQSGPDVTDYTQGGMQSTGNPYDVALQGDGFFQVRTPEGVRYTRDGRFLRDAQNNLVTVEGFNVLNQNGQPIRLADGTLSIAADGILAVNGAQAGKLGISFFKDPRAELTRARGNLFSGPAQSTAAGKPQVAQGYLEASNANPTHLMAEMVEVARSYEAAQKMVQNEDELLGKSIASLGRIG